MLNVRRRFVALLLGALAVCGFVVAGPTSPASAHTGATPVYLASCYGNSPAPYRNRVTVKSGYDTVWIGATGGAIAWTNAGVAATYTTYQGDSVAYVNVFDHYTGNYLGKTYSTWQGQVSC